MEEKIKEFKLSKISKTRLKGVDERLINLIERVIKVSGVYFEIPEYGGLRTAQIQNNLFHKKSKENFEDGFKIKSSLQKGLGFRVEIKDTNQDYKELSNLFKKEFDKMILEEIFKPSEKIIWGGDFIRNKNTSHFEVQ